MQKLRIGILMGGRSSEKEVSFNSGRTVCDHLDSTLYDIVPIFQTTNGTLYRLPWHFLHRGKSSDFVHRLPTEAEVITWDHLPSCVDFLYIAQHGRYAEDGILQGTLEVLGVPYLGSGILASALGMDKRMQKAFLRMHHITVARDVFLSADEVLRFMHDEDKSAHTICSKMKSAGLSFPCVIKPQHEGSSIGISIVHQEDQLYAAIIKAATVHEHLVQGILIEEKIEGTEFTCVTITDYKTGALLPLPPTEIIPESGTEFFTYDQKYMPGRATKFTPARLPQEIIEKIQQTCLAVMQALGIISLSRIDGIVTKEGAIVIIDPNTFAGISPSSFLFNQAAEINMSHTQLINHLIETELHIRKLLKNPMHTDKKDNPQSDTRLRVAVLMGGASNEREISLESGRNVFYKLSPYQYESYPLFVDNQLHLYELPQSLLVRNSTKEIAQSLQPTMRWSWHDLKKKVDFVFIGLHGGLGENGGVQGMLEMLDIPYNGSGVLASALCMDKFKTNLLLQQHGLHTPMNMLVTRELWSSSPQTIVDQIGQQFKFPLIIKPHDDGCSVMVQKVCTPETVAAALNHIFNHGKSAALVEEFIVGMELTVGVLGNENPHILPPSQTVVSNDILSIEEKFLPGAGENQTPAPLPAAAIQLVQEEIHRAFTTLGCKGYARIDCFYQTKEQSPTNTERVVILEVNTLPGLTPATCIFHQAAEIGLRPMEFIDHIIHLGLQAHQPSKEHAIKQSLSSITTLAL